MELYQLNPSERIEDKVIFEIYALNIGVVVKKYYADNGMFTPYQSMNQLVEANQNI